MATNVFDLFAKLSLDSSEYDKGLDAAKSAGSSLGTGLASAAKIGMAAVGAATTAVVGFGAASVKTGMSFDQSMSQVAATMGKTTDEITELRDFAQEMGRTTAFSATEAADALNYMALAGYDANESMTMLPNVLNLASAGAMDLARASDMVTDAQSALGLEMEDMDGFVDQLAKTASSSNTSVEQLGDAILTIGGTAKTLAGGTTELNTALGILGDNGIKGAEAGTKLRNVVLSLSAPTDKAAQELEALGVATTDAEGNMLPLEDVMAQLSGALDGLGTADRAEVINTIFNKQDIAAVNALLDTSADRWDELSAAIDDSAGAADKMAKTQLDNLAGSVTLFKSALEGAQIAISDTLSPSLKEFVDFGTEGLSKLTGAFQEGGLEGAMTAFGEILSDGLNMVIKKLPDAVNAGMELLSALGQGILDNLDVIIDAAVQIIQQLLLGLVQALPALAEGALQIIVGLAEGIAQMLPVLIPTIVNVILQIVQTLIDNIDLLIDGAIQLMVGLAMGLIQALPVIIERLPEIVMGIANALIENLPILWAAEIQVILALAQAIIENLPEFINAVIQIIVEIGSLIIQKGAELLSSVNQLISNILESVKAWLAQLPQQIAYWLGAMVAKWVEFWVMLIPRTAVVLANVIAKIKEFANNLRTSAGEAAEGFKNRLIDGFRDLPSRMLDIGRNIVEGLKNGISNAWSSLTGWVKDLCDNLVKGFTENLKIGSPSKVFRDEVGKWIPAGIAEGITENAKVLYNAIDDVTANMIPDISAAMSDIRTVNNVTATNGMGYSGGFVQNLTINSPRELNPSEVARQTRNASREMVLRLRTV